eukprot:TRINITY_DN24652_c0_g1_i1.p1 TRINITY_DN24652_c0_g1~~TRINITY_DN24652_c0_g1_i1.p1  ORF type:complete len:353 (-),score=56.96 TRINITY_DN24652_c0_g1_i1:334-1392(-)
MIRRPPRSTLSSSSAASDVYKRQILSEEDAMAKTACGTPYYLPPEICQGNAYGPQNDVWAAGVLGFELLTLKRPFEGKNLASVIMQICHSQHRFPKYPKVSRPAMAVIGAILTKDAATRPPVPELLEMAWLTNAFNDLEAVYPSLGVMPSADCHVTNSEEPHSSDRFDQYLVSLLLGSAARNSSRAALIQESGFGERHTKSEDRRLVMSAKRTFGGRVLGELHERFHSLQTGEYDIEAEVDFLEVLEERITATKEREREESSLTEQLQAPVNVAWEADGDVAACTRCAREFSLFCRRHHCRLCGRIFCSRCCDQKAAFPQLGFAEPVRACLICRPQTPGRVAVNSNLEGGML